MLTLDDLEVLATAKLPFEIYKQLRDSKIKLSQLVYVGVDNFDFYCYICPDNTILRLPERIES